MALRLSGIHPNPVQNRTQPSEIEDNAQLDTPDQDVVIPADPMDTPSLKTVFQAPFEQPSRCCHSMQTQKKTRTAIEPTDVATNTSASGPVDMGDTFVEKFVLAPTPFQIILDAGNITEKTVQSVINPNTSHLNCAVGISQEIADAGGTDFAKECTSHIHTYTTLPVTSVTHTTAWNMRLHIDIVVHVVWPVFDDYSDSDILQRTLVSAVLKTLHQRSPPSNLPGHTGHQRGFPLFIEH